MTDFRGDDFTYFQPPHLFETEKDYRVGDCGAAGTLIGLTI